MNVPVRKSVKVLLMNDNKEILLMCADDPKTTAKDGTYHGKFWFTIGGKIENGESINEAAIREIHEETGITEDEIELGPIVWHGEFDLLLDNILTRLDQTFIVVKTKKNDIFLHAPDDWEKKVIKELKWFSLEDIINCENVIFPVVLPKYLPAILEGKYPDKCLEIDLAKQPNRK